jgi:hypothetical protein
MIDIEKLVQSEAAARPHVAKSLATAAADEKTFANAAERDQFIREYAEGVEQCHARIVSILSAPESRLRQEAAINLAFSTNLPLESVRGILAGLPERRDNIGLAFDSAMSRDNPELGAGGNFTEDADSRSKVDGVLRAAGYDKPK